jgi:hypothetical protein
MNSESANAIHHHEIANLAFLNWHRDGCPTGRDQHYWLEAEHQIRATKHLLVGEILPPVPGTAPAAKSKSGKTPKKSAVAKLAK